MNGTPQAAEWANNPMLNAEQFVRKMQDAVRENETMNMGNHDEDAILAGWKDAQSIISVYDEDDGEFPTLTPDEQAYAITTLDAWLADHAPVIAGGEAPDGARRCD